jgi:tRNA A37 threonylcarbamoyladenosine dehydratase
VVDESNLNRQIPLPLAMWGKESRGGFFTGQKHPARRRSAPRMLFGECEAFKEHDYSSCDFLVDAMDDIPAKMALIHYAFAHEIPFLISLGMGNRLDPSKVTLCRLDKTEGDPLAKKLRNELRKKASTSKKSPPSSPKRFPLVRGKKPASLMMVPSEAGLLLASTV